MSGTQALTPTEQLFANDRPGRLGTWLTGCVADILLQGLILHQTWLYFSTFRNKDSRITQAFVGIVAVANVLKSVQSFAILWNLFIVGFGDYAYVSSPSWQEHSETLTTAIIGLLVQCFFVYRVFRLLTGRVRLQLCICAAIIANMLLGFGGAIGLTVVILNTSVSYQADFQTPVSCMLAGMVVADFLITGTVLWCLLALKVQFHAGQADRTSFSDSTGRIVARTNSLLDRVMTVTWISAVPPTVCAFLNLGFYVGTSDKNSIFISFNLALPKLYTISLMVALLSRPISNDDSGVYDTSRGSLPQFAISTRSAATEPSSITFNPTASSDSSSRTEGMKRRRPEADGGEPCLDANSWTTEEKETSSV